MLPTQLTATLLVLAALAAPAFSPPRSPPKTFEAKVNAAAMDFRDDITKRIEHLLDSGKLTVPKLFDTFYIPIPKTYPQKFHTQYDQVFDESLQAALDGYLARDSRFLYVILADANGYVPTHNSRFARPLTGSREYDAQNNRTKLMFNDRTGLTAARSKAPSLLQEYQRDNGETMLDLSVPVFIRNQHWGCLRIGYRKN